MVCANANRTHKIPMLLTDKSQNPWYFKNTNISLMYKNQKKGMDGHRSVYRLI